jgi:hypothetical protein
VSLTSTFSRELYEVVPAFCRKIGGATCFGGVVLREGALPWKKCKARAGVACRLWFHDNTSTYESPVAHVENRIVLFMYRYSRDLRYGAEMHHSGFTCVPSPITEC